MENNNKFTIYIEKKWISGDTCVFNIHNQFDRLQVKSYISSKRKQFVERLKMQGFNITVNKEDIKEDTLCLIMDDIALCDKDTTMSKYIKIFNKKIFENAGENFNYPTSMSVKEFFDNPFFQQLLKMN